MPHLDVDDCVLVVIDAQPRFYGPTRTDVDPDLFAIALTRSAWGFGRPVLMGNTLGRAIPARSRALESRFAEVDRFLADRRSP